MESRTRTASESHSEYYLGIESDCESVARYVEFSDDHRKVYSHYFSHMLTTAGAEFESVSKAIAVAANKPEPKMIFEIRNLYIPIESYLKSCSLRLLKGDITITPFCDWEIGTSPIWWKAYNDIKHSRHTNAKSGSMFNALQALGALFFANLVLADTEHGYGIHFKYSHRTRLFYLNPFENEPNWRHGPDSVRPLHFLSVGELEVNKRMRELIGLKPTE